MTGRANFFIPSSRVDAPDALQGLHNQPSSPNTANGCDQRREQLDAKRRSSKK